MIRSARPTLRLSSGAGGAPAHVNHLHVNYIHGVRFGLRSDVYNHEKQCLTKSAFGRATKVH